MSELERVYRELDAGDSFEVFERIESHRPPQDAARIYHTLVKQIYSQKRDVPRMILIGRAGIQFCLSEAKKNREADPLLASELLGLAKSMAYDVSANAWPGWQDEGVVITRTDLALGLDCARLNLRLAKELKRNEEILGNAHWLLGAQLLAGDKPSEAEFQSAAEQFRHADKADYQEMAHGYAALARLKQNPSDELARREMTNRIRTLRTLEGPDAKFFADQLEQVSAYFLKESSTGSPSVSGGKP